MLEDFFTLTELKDGISTVARIEELVSGIKTLKNSVDGNLGDSIRQWSAVASTLAATENVDCLQHFVQLNGLFFLNQWLQNALCWREDASSNAVEESIDAILTSLEHLPIDSEHSTSSGIRDTVKKFVTHGNVKINAKAGRLCEKWTGTNNDDMNCQHIEKDRTGEIDQPNPSNISKATENGRQGEASEADCMAAKLNSGVTKCLEVSCIDPLDKETVHLTKELQQVASSVSQEANAIVGDVNSSTSSLMSHGCLENMSLTQGTSRNTTGLASAGMSQSKFDDVKIDDQHAALVRVTVDVRSTGVDKLDEKPPIDSKTAMKDNNVSCNLDINNEGSITSDKLQPEIHIGFGGGKQSLLMEGVNRFPHITHSQDPSNEGEGSAAMPRMKKTTLDVIKGIGRETKLKGSKGMDTVSRGSSSRTAEKNATLLTGEKSNLFMEYDDTDALEVARLVAIEVEREVIDYREASCSSAELHSDDMREAASPDIEVPQQSHPATEAINGDRAPEASGHSQSSSSLKEDGSGITDDSVSFNRKHGRDSNLASSAQELDSKSARDPCELDLNANGCSGELDCFVKPDTGSFVSLSTPIPVAASRGASTFPATPLHFEGELGWKGSAATSAFRRASPRRTPDGEKTSSAPTLKASFLGFDLNVAGSEDNDVAGPQSTEAPPLSSSIPSSVSSAAVGLTKAEKLNLDLNCPCEEGSSSNASLFWNRQPHNDHYNQSSTSSSSSRQPALRNFDLNDSTTILDGTGSHAKDETSVRSSSTHGEALPEHPAITIMGSRIALGSKDHHNHIQHSYLSNGHSTEGSVFARSVLPYSHMPPSNYGSISYPPGTVSTSFPPAFYGPGNVPYVVDYKGAPTVPPMMGLGLNGAQPSLTRATNAASTNEFGYFQPSVDTNYGMLSLEVGHKEGGFFRPMFLQGHTVLVDEHARLVSQSSNHGMLSKRKEPDSGWDSYSRG